MTHLSSPTPDRTAARGVQVALRAVTRRYRTAAGTDVLALDDVTLAIDPGRVVALTGPSGSGKSTLLHLVGAVDRPSSGQVEIDGTELGRLGRAQLADYRRGVGFVFQRFNLLPALTVLDNVMAPVLPYRMPFDKPARARELLDQVGLAGREHDPPSRLSGGQQQRVAIARALINTPGLLLADEPTGSLDSTTGSAILDLLLDLRDSHGLTVIIATHDESVARRADRRITLTDGRLD